MQDPYKHFRTLALVATVTPGVFASVVVVFGALLLGLWLDATFRTRPTFTLILLLLSIPVSLVAMFFSVLGTLRNIKPSEPTTTQKEDTPWQEKH
jgi:MFS-type transporter involved in bile tolerance (Atg22 family)